MVTHAASARDIDPHPKALAELAGFRRMLNGQASHSL